MISTHQCPVCLSPLFGTQLFWCNSCQCFFVLNPNDGTLCKTAYEGTTTSYLGREIPYSTPSEPCTGAASSSRDTLTLETLASVILKLWFMPPRPIAFWFVDRPAEYLWFISQFDTKTDDYVVSNLGGPICLYGIPLRQFTNSIATEEELARFPFFCSIPGIWVEMSEGNHVRLAEL